MPQVLSIDTTGTECPPIANKSGLTRRSGNIRARTRGLIESTVAQVFGVRHSDLEIATRGRAPIALARQVAMYLAHVACGFTLTEVGKLFERDRTTVGHACGVVEDRRDDPMFDRVLELLEWAIPTLIAPRRTITSGFVQGSLTS